MKISIAATGTIAPTPPGIQIKRLNSTLNISGVTNYKRVQKFVGDSIAKLSGGDERLCQFEALDDQLFVVFYDPNRITIEAIEKNVSEALIASCVRQPNLD